MSFGNVKDTREFSNDIDNELCSVQIRCQHDFFKYRPQILCSLWAVLRVIYRCQEALDRLRIAQCHLWMNVDRRGRWRVPRR